MLVISVGPSSSFTTAMAMRLRAHVRTGSMIDHVGPENRPPRSCEHLYVVAGAARTERSRWKVTAATSTATLQAQLMLPASIPEVSRLRCWFRQKSLQRTIYYSRPRPQRSRQGAGRDQPIAERTPTHCPLAGNLLARTAAAATRTAANQVKFLLFLQHCSNVQEFIVCTTSGDSCQPPIEPLDVVLEAEEGPNHGDEPAAESPLTELESNLSSWVNRVMRRSP